MSVCLSVLISIIIEFFLWQSKRTKSPQTLKQLSETMNDDADDSSDSSAHNLNMVC